jgi:hypothetical protein
VAEGAFFRNQGVTLNPVRQPDRLAFPLGDTRCLRFYRFVTRRNRGIETSELCARKHDVSAFGPGGTVRSARAGACDDHIILKSLFHHRRFLSSNHPDL